LLGIDRDLAKQVNFGICFGISAAPLAGRINYEIVKRNRTRSTEQRQPRKQQPLIHEPEAQDYIDHFHDRYPSVRAFFVREWEKLKNPSQNDRVVRSPLGRIRRFASFPSKALERRFHRIFQRRNIKAHIVMMIHDALWVDAREDETEQVRLLMRRMMTTASKLRVPLEMDIS
jgi:DNA polymerase I-like protein with 3'-5' exonuclease and polymerase domains